MVEQGSCEPRRDGETCRYCTRPPFAESPSGDCICHAPENSSSVDARRQLWLEARAEAEGECDFQGWQFPEDPGEGYFRDVRFRAAPNFSRSVFRCAVIFDRCRVEPSSDAMERRWTFDGARFQAEANFAGAFLGGADFNRVRFERGANFLNASFGKDGVSFNDSLFRGPMSSFAQTKFSGFATFFRAVFGLDVSFREAQFAPGEHLISFYRSEFHGRADFESADFASVDLSHVTFGGETSFRHTQFKHSVNLQGATVRSGVSFHLDRPRGLLCRNWPFPSDLAAESAYRLAKQAAQNCGDYAGAGDYHYCERCAGNRGRRVLGRRGPGGTRGLGKAWFDFAFGRLIFGYSERPLRILGVSLAIVLIMAVLALLLAGIEESESVLHVTLRPQGPATPTSSQAASPIESAPRYDADFRQRDSVDRKERSFWRCFYFSLVTFTTLGYGDFHPLPHFRLVASAEAALGAVFMAMFVVSLTRRYMR